MKKIFSIFLVVTMLFSMSITSFAGEITTDNTSQNVTVTYGASQSFTVTIPSAINIDDSGAYETIVTAEDVLIPYGSVLNVTVDSLNADGEDWYLTDVSNDENFLTYSILSGNPDGDINMVANGGNVLSCPAGFDDIMEYMIRFELIDIPTRAGTYKDTLTFTVSVDYVDLINFTVDGTSYQAEEGMTWAQFINSKYNPDYECYDSEKKFGDGEYAGYSNRVVYHRYDDCSDESYFRVSIQDYEINEGGELEQVRITDEIIANGAYESDNP